jgi:hypothetical protein
MDKIQTLMQEDRKRRKQIDTLVQGIRPWQ